MTVCKTIHFQYITCTFNAICIIFSIIENMQTIKTPTVLCDPLHWCTLVVWFSSDDHLSNWSFNEGKSYKYYYEEWTPIFVGTFWGICGCCMSWCWKTTDNALISWQTVAILFHLLMVSIMCKCFNVIIFN